MRRALEESAGITSSLTCTMVPVAVTKRPAFKCINAWQIPKKSVFTLCFEKLYEGALGPEGVDGI
jgi:hypothetical protein